MPEKDEFLTGHKYPFNACELLCCENGLNLNLLLKSPLSNQKKFDNYSKFLKILEPLKQLVKKNEERIQKAINNAGVC